MNIKQLKKMISEEYRYWLAEQPIDTPEAPGMPGIEVGPGDVDAMGGGGDSEATLRQIFDMLKDYFEGGAAGAMDTPAPVSAPMPAGDDMDADDDMDDEEEEEEEVSEKKSSKKDKKEAKELKERFKKLANIIKG